ncbi:hypothetical protein G1C98_0518 [Bifidobacterium sp. DSM 109960]|uniref:Uncharacterized protein n=1 Tax=Bifidobacterium erythrocebi TaxID=2675325 RepID=A0A7Y0EST9_9BIFI|nr:hypothetical protein [Bifidobacterium sp. DSM 109960]NMM95782.1 hypothetical protein [Bifidobacterium sp. DSM 109960]
MADMPDDTNDKDINPDEPLFSDEELDAAMSDFEREFAQSDDAAQSDLSEQIKQNDQNGQIDGETNGDHAETPAAGDIDFDSIDIPDDASEIDPSVGFEDELAGLIGNKAKRAALITRIASAELLAAFCQLSDISADCVGSNQGAVAVLRNLDGDGPEAAAKDITTVVSGMSVILGVNRADKLEVTMYAGGKPGPTLAPPILFNSTPRFVEDLMLGIVTAAQLKEQGLEVVDSGRFDHASAMQVIARHTRPGKGGSVHGASIE